MRVFRELPNHSNTKRVSYLSHREALKLLSKGGEDVHFSSDSPEWYTPKEIIDLVETILGEIDLDPCSNAEKNVPAGEHFTEKQNGLTRRWNGRVYMNPPYGTVIQEWVLKFRAEYVSGRMTEGIALLPSRTDTEWFHQLREFPRAFLRGRLKFSQHQNSAPFPSMLLYAGRNLKRFGQAVADVGCVYVPL